MTRSSLPIAVPLAAVAALLLTACGAGASDTSDKIQPPPPPRTTTPPPPAAPTTAGAAVPDAPTFALPPDITVEFKGFDGTAENKAVLQDAVYAAKSVLELEARTRSKATSNFARFFTGERGAAYADALIGQGKDGGVITGTYRYYSSAVKPLQGGNLQVQYCEDQRKAYAKDSKTGKVGVTTPSASDFRLWTLLMSKSPSGEWHVYDHTWIKGAKQCEVA
ncbi:hypothetical protein [Actinacidiphila sp. ITFR-21]|uniref:hypothetical protein n=1 Tax=Actinacidiphila sp. ITFR-21 TaxID=3075199 RepID=UPI00288C29CD|nr:hypothetical protein [Streptomyces sp. ITFR-21]WNI16985.1 hypothetical protein RLT57_16625 [Streptomyces sp. ITFR-21]